MRVDVISMVIVAALGSSAQAGLLSPSHYLAFDDPAAGGSISPFAGAPFAYFYLEDFEDGFLDTSGVIGIGGSVVGPGGNTDSVDEDDGAIDGSGTNGRSYFRLTGSAGVAFEFNALILGFLPTHVGIVWTDGLGEVTFRAYDANAILLGSSTATPATALTSGQTDEDTFFGVIHSGGISRVEISNAMGGIEVDHLQYGATASTLVPEPSSIALLCSGILSLIGFRLRRCHSERDVQMRLKPVCRSHNDS